MTDALVETKLLLPRPRRDVVPRPRLAGLLERARGAPVTLVSAPAGFGKTSLLATWLSAGDRPVAWVSLDERDRQPATYWTYVLLALDRAVPGAGAAALTLLESGQASTESALAAAVNLLNPQVVALGGFLAALLAYDPDRLHARVAAASLPTSFEGVRITATEVGSRLLMIGAARLAFSPLLADPSAVARRDEFGSRVAAQ